jgi:hypothetical protein
MCPNRENYVNLANARKDTYSFITNLRKDGGTVCDTLMFSPDSNSLVSASGVIWSIPEGEVLSTFGNEHANRRSPITISPAGTLLVVANQVYSLPDGTFLTKLEENREIYDVSFQTGGTGLVILSEDGVEFWSIEE